MEEHTGHCTARFRWREKMETNLCYEERFPSLLLSFHSGTLEKQVSRRTRRVKETYRKGRDDLLCTMLRKTLPTATMGGAQELCFSVLCHKTLSYVGTFQPSGLQSASAALSTALLRAASGTKALLLKQSTAEDTARQAGEQWGKPATPAPHSDFDQSKD